MGGVWHSGEGLGDEGAQQSPALARSAKADLVHAKQALHRAGCDLVHAESVARPLGMVG